MIYLYSLVLLLIACTSCSFINHSDFRHAVDPDDQLEYLTNYLEDFATMLSTADVNGDLYYEAVHEYHRGLKESFLADLKRMEGPAGSSVEIAGESAFQDIMARFQECALRALPHEPPRDEYRGSRNHRRRRNHHVSPTKSKGRVLECAEEAEIKIVEAVADSMAAMADADRTRETIKMARLAENNVKAIRRIVSVRRGREWRWPWLTDEGWTWPWILALIVILIVSVLLLATAGWFAYEKINQTDDSWGGDVEDKECEEA